MNRRLGAPKIRDWTEVIRIGTERARSHEGSMVGVYTSRDNTDRHVQAALAEAWVADQLGLEWVSEMGTYKSKPDVLPDIEVRCINKPTNPLHVMANDIQGRRIVAVAGRHPNFVITGWCWTQDAPYLGTWEKRPGARGGGVWAVPQSELLHGGLS